jgi:hypothetical protein
MVGYNERSEIGSSMGIIEENHRLTGSTPAGTDGVSVGFQTGG